MAAKRKPITFEDVEPITGDDEGWVVARGEHKGMELRTRKGQSIEEFLDILAADWAEEDKGNRKKHHH